MHHQHAFLNGARTLEPAEIGCVRALVASAFAVADDELLAASRRTARAAFARQVAMYLAHIGFGIPHRDVGRLFARHRSTAAHACQVVEDRRDDRDVDYALDRLEAAARLWAGAAKSAMAPGHG